MDNESMNQKIEDFNIDDELFPALVKAYAHKLSNIFILKQLYERYT